METIESKDFHEMSKESATILKVAGYNIDPNERKKHEIQVERGKVLKDVEEATGTKSKVFRSSEPGYANIAGFYDDNVHLKNDTLDNLLWALHVKRHEDLHPKVISTIEINTFLSKEHSEPIVESLKAEPELAGIKRLDDINWVEGFTELVNITENSKHNNCAYVNFEVPAAIALDELCKEHTGESLMGPFKSKNVAQFYYILRKLADHMLLEQVVYEIDAEPDEIDEIRALVEKKMEQGHMAVANKDDAKRLIAKFIAEEVALKQVRKKLASTSSN